MGGAVNSRWGESRPQAWEWAREMTTGKLQWWAEWREVGCSEAVLLSRSQHYPKRQPANSHKINND